MISLLSITAAVAGTPLSPALARADDIIVLPALPPAGGLADHAAFRSRRWHVSGVVSVVTEARLPTVPFKIVTARLPFRRAYAASLVASRVVIPRFAVALPGVTLRGNSLEVEAQVMQHFGRERSTEVAAAAVLRSGQIGVTRQTSFNVAWGNGLSYAIDAPRGRTARRHD